jgi:coenzyme F420-dependent glucose-6-phosphate dehydrogenase
VESDPQKINIMAIISYHASHEQFKPSELLTWAMLAETAGFEGINSSDHFYPWSERQGESGFSFAWLGAAMQATGLPFGMVCAPGPRYHPTVLAQAAATLAEMFPGRFTMALGSGEALNENVTGEPWPDKETRNQRLYESADAIKRLLQGENVNFEGTISVKDARLYTLPKRTPRIIAAAVTEKTAAWLGSWADGMITIHKPQKELQAMIDAFEGGGGKGKEKYLKVQLSYAHSHQEALSGAWHQWRTNVLSHKNLGDFSQPAQFDREAEKVTVEQLEKMVLISSDPQQFVDWIQQYIAMGFENIILHNVNREQEQFIRDFGEKVLPHCKS